MTEPVLVSRIQNRRGTQSQFENLYPPGYNGIGGADIVLWPNLLLSGELALCTDSRRIFLGNINGEYIELTSSSAIDSVSLVLSPLTVILPPTPTPVVIPELEYDITPFFSFLYDITDSPNLDWNTIGTTFSRNGELKVTAIDHNTVIPLYYGQPVSHVNLSDVGTEVNSTSYDVSFMAGYNGPFSKIEISYTHNFPTSLTFNTTTIRWLPF